MNNFVKKNLIFWEKSTLASQNQKGRGKKSPLGRFFRLPQTRWTTNKEWRTSSRHYSHRSQCGAGGRPRRRKSTHRRMTDYLHPLFLPLLRSHFRQLRLVGCCCHCCRENTAGASQRCHRTPTGRCGCVAAVADDRCYCPPSRRCCSRLTRPVWWAPRGRRFPRPEHRRVCVGPCGLDPPCNRVWGRRPGGSGKSQHPWMATFAMMRTNYADGRGRIPLSVFPTRSDSHPDETGWNAAKKRESALKNWPTNYQRKTPATKQSINQSINRSTEWMVNQINQSINWAIEQTLILKNERINDTTEAKRKKTPIWNIIL